MNSPLVEGSFTVAVDADGVVIDFASGVADFAWRTRKVRYDPSQIHPNPTVNSDHELRYIIMDLLDRPEEVEKLQPYPDAREGLYILYEEGYDSQIVSVRDASTLGEVTRRCAEINGLSPYISNFHLRDGWSWGAEFKVGKAQKLKVVAAFDDDDHLAYSYARAGFRTFHIRNPNLAPNHFQLNSPLLTQHPTFLEGVRALVGQPTRVYTFT